MAQRFGGSIGGGVGVAGAVLAGLAGADAAHAGEYAPFLPAPGSGNVDLTFLRQDGPTLLLGRQRVQPWEQLTLNSYQVSLSYGLTDRLALDGRLGFSETDFEIVPGVREPGRSGLGDTTIGLRFRLADEFAGAPVTVAFGASAIIQGAYTPDAIDAIGEGGSGVQIGLSLGKFITDKLAVTAEVGGRARFNQVPEEVFASIEAAYVFSERVSAWTGFATANSLSGLQLGAPGVTFADFPALEEDSNLWHGGLSISLAKNVSLTGSYGRKFGGRNTLLGGFFRVGVSYSF